MTYKEFVDKVNDEFLFGCIDKNMLSYVERFATQLAQEHWEGIHWVNASTSNGFDIDLHLVFKTEQDYVWFSLKNM